MAPLVEFDKVSFRYPAADEVSLESLVLPMPERSHKPCILREVSFYAVVGQLTPVVGSSGAGKTTITRLVLAFTTLLREQSGLTAMTFAT